MVYMFPEVFTRGYGPSVRFRPLQYRESLCGGSWHPERGARGQARRASGGHSVPWPMPSTLCPLSSAGEEDAGQAFGLLHSAAPQLRGRFSGEPALPAWLWQTSLKDEQAGCTSPRFARSHPELVVEEPVQPERRNHPLAQAHWPGGPAPRNPRESSRPRLRVFCVRTAWGTPAGVPFLAMILLAHVVPQLAQSLR